MGKNWVYLGGKPGKDSKRLSFLSSHFQKIEMTRRKMRQILIGPLLDDRLK